jgi:hypothetical protein
MYEIGRSTNAGILNLSYWSTFMSCLLWISDSSTGREVCRWIFRSVPVFPMPHKAFLYPTRPDFFGVRRRLAAGEDLGHVDGITLRSMLFVLLRKVPRILSAVPTTTLGLFRSYGGRTILPARD